jgi:5-methyltetrahydropteroyltriglutamate--homocysteine methyltransferase
LKLALSSTGSYPRVGDTPELQILRRTIAAADRGERTAADLADAERAMTRRAIEEQVRAGLEVLTDGQICWYDPISHFPGKLEGVRIGGLLRFFDTNFYFRQPILTRRPKRGTASPLADEYRFARNALGLLPTAPERAGKLKMKPAVTGAYTLAKFSIAEDAGMKSLAARAEAYAEALAGELRALIAAGADFIQIDEPGIVKYPEDWDVFERSWQQVAALRQEPGPRGRPTRLALYVYFHDCAALYEKLARLPVDALGVDFTYNPRLVDVVAAAGSPVPLGLGLVDGRNTKLEEPAAVARQIEKILPKVAGEEAYLGPSCGLEFLPRDRAYAKLELLGRIRQAVAG